jgi:sterol desaturase/sphingolipid hydroxylase (fatty acid hydroxylase superfamily)
MFSIIKNISIRSLKKFLYINTILISFATAIFNVESYESLSFGDIAINTSINILKNYTLIYFIDEHSKNKKRISNEIPKENYIGEFHMNVVSSSMIETISKYLYINQIYIKNNYIYDIITFIPISFLFEIIFDLFHYIFHRLCHENKILYKYIHKKHHRYDHPSSIITFYQSQFDILLTNTLPMFITLKLIPNISQYQLNIILLYKSFIEISGHSGVYSYPTSSFPQCIYLAKNIGIELYTEDHNLHHSLNNCNYSKRFSLWDKIFNTYKSKKNKN